MGPQGFQDHHQVYLRTAVSVDAAGWAHFDYVKLPDYRWGIFLAEPTPDRRIGFGDFKGQPVWQEVPGEFRNPLRRLIVLQGDTEPASVEQQRSSARIARASTTCATCSRSTSKKAATCGRWSTCCTRTSAATAAKRPRRCSSAAAATTDSPRMLEAFNEPIDTWLDFFAFTMFTDRDGKSQLLSLSESSLDPLSRTTRFMLTEEAHHMFVGETGIARILERTCQLMKEAGFSGDVRKVGGIDIPLIQKFVNFWFSQSLDLHGSEVSSNAANYFSNGLKGRAEEDKFEDDHVLDGSVYLLDLLDESGRINRQEVPMRNALNEVLRDWYVGDCQAGVDRWNKRVLEAHGIPDRIYPAVAQVQSQHRHLRRAPLRSVGQPLSAEEWERRKDEWLPMPADKDYLRSIQVDPGLQARAVRQLHRAAAARHQSSADRLRIRSHRSVLQQIRPDHQITRSP